MNDLRIVLLVFIVGLVASGLIVGGIANSKGRDPVPWFFFGAFFFLPALIVILVKEPTPEQQRSTWVRSGGRLCEECRQPINFGASRCHYCGAQQSVRSPDRHIAIERSVGAPDGRLSFKEADAIAFFASELANASSVSVLGRATSREEEALLEPLVDAHGLSSPRVRAKCRVLVDDAMKAAADEAGWSIVDGTQLPTSWAQHYEVLADLGDAGPALIAFIEDRTAGSQEAPRSSEAFERENVVYDLTGWSAKSRGFLCHRLKKVNVEYTLRGQQLSVPSSDEATVDSVVESLLVANENG